MGLMEIINIRMTGNTLPLKWDRDRIKLVVRSYIAESLLMSERRVIADDELLIETGVVDSGSACELAAFFESVFGVRIADAEINEDNFGAIDRMVRFIERKAMAPSLS
jgi:acyl carrier protein